jgi:hypothetical protein
LEEVEPAKRPTPYRSSRKMLKNRICQRKPAYFRVFWYVKLAEKQDISTYNLLKNK